MMALSLSHFNISLGASSPNQASGNDEPADKPLESIYNEYVAALKQEGKLDTSSL